MQERIKIDIPISTMVKVALTLLAFWVAYLIRDVILLLFVVGILVAAFRPVVKSWGKRIGKVPAVLILVLILFGFIVGFVSLIVPPLAEQIKQLANNIPDLIAKATALRDHFPAIQQALDSLSNNVGNLTGSFISITFGFFGGLVAFVTAIILTIYLLLDDNIFNSFAELVPLNKRDEVKNVVEKITQKIGNWLRGQLTLGLIIGIVVYIGLSLLGIKYALTLAVLSGVLEFVPIFGPIISGTLAAILGLSQSLWIALAVVVLYLLISQLENSFLVPKIMQKAIGLPPVIIIIAILIGGKLFGIFGGLLAVPVSGIIYVIVQDWTTIKSIASR